MQIKHKDIIIKVKFKLRLKIDREDNRILIWMIIKNKNNKEIWNFSMLDKKEIIR
jgi:hypothetical protein